MPNTLTSWMRTSAILAITLGVSVSSVAAQTMAASAPAAGLEENVVPGTPDFAKAVSGNVVWITTKDGARHKGRVAGVTTTGLTWSGRRSQPLPFDQIVKVQRASHRLRKSLLISLAVGGGLQFLVTAASAYPDESCLMATFMCTGGVATIGLGPPRSTTL